MRISYWSSDVCSSDLHQGGRLHFTTSLAEAIPDADVVILAVGTPDNADGSVNLDAVFAAGRLVAEHLQGSTVVVTKSTVPVGTSRALYRTMREVNPDAAFETASNPEFLRERSEEHTSELQSLMRTSYAVFCLKQKPHTHHLHHHNLPSLY